MTKRATGVFAVLALMGSACGASPPGEAAFSQTAESSTTVPVVIATTSTPSAGSSETTATPVATTAPTTITASTSPGNLLIDLGVLSSVTLELYATDQIAGSVNKPRIRSLTNQSQIATFDVEPGVYDVVLLHDGASVILDNYECGMDRCDRSDPREGFWQIADFTSALLVYGFVEQMHDLDPYLGGVWAGEDQQTLYVSVTGDLDMRSELLRLAGFDVDSPHIELAHANYTMVELEAAFEAIGADADVLVERFNAHSRRVDTINNVVVVATSDVDTAALADYLSRSFPTDMVTVNGGVEPTVISP